ncbi:MAG: Ig-like domain-containing protein, partial [Akkermansiaceae bacterium]
TSFFQAGDQQRSQATNPGEIYNENSAGDLHARMQEIIDLYFLNLDLTSPTPNPTTFDIPPAALGRNSVTMTATTASDPSDVEYYFECTAGGGNDSGWQDDKIYTDTDLTSAIQYTYRVRARDKSLNQNPTGWSATASATTDVPDTPPSLHATIPADNTTGVSFATDLTATFSEDIVIGSGNIIIQKTGGGTLATIPVTDGTQVSVAGATLTIFPSANFATATGYFVEISAGAIVDKDGNDFAGISGSSVWNFTTDNNEGILAGELGILDPTSANGGINPATGVPWAEGDRYHLAFVTSGTRNATSGDIADYHAFVQAAAAAAGMGGATWYCVGQSYNDPSRDVNAPPMTTSTSIILADGVTKLADDGPDLANGPDHPFSITELGTSYLGFVATGSGRKFGTPDEPKIEVGNSAANWWQAFNSPKTNQWHFYAISEELKIVRETSGSFAGWIGGYNVGELIGFADDPDGDGLVNGIEAFFGSDPSVQSSGLTQLSKSGNVFTVQHPQALELPSDISGSYMWSTNLEDWYSVADSGIGTIVSIVATPNDPQEGITTARATVTGNVVNELFLRVAVNQE